MVMGILPGSMKIIGRAFAASVRWLLGIEDHVTAPGNAVPAKPPRGPTRPAHGPSGAPASPQAAQTPAPPVRPPGKKGRAKGRRTEPPPDGTAHTSLSHVCRYLDDDQFAYHLREDGSGIDTGFRGKTGTFSAVITVRENPPILGVFIRIPLVVPEDRRAAVAETVVRANYGLSIGSFDMDMSDGTVGFRATMPIADAMATHGQFRDLMGASLWTVDRYHRAFGRLLFGDDLSPAEVIAEVDMGD